MLFIIISNFQSILVADEQSVLEQSTETGLSLALGIISSYLEDKGIQVMMSDLNKQFGSYHFLRNKFGLLAMSIMAGRFMNILKEHRIAI